jgi:cholesterol oxidase
MPTITNIANSAHSTRPAMHDAESATDWVVIGSGFGGSVSALRLAEKGHAVTVLEAGRRFEDADLPRSTADLRRYFYAPLIGLRGIFRMTLFRDMFLASGAGVGGGSLGYASTLYRAPEPFYSAPEWSDLADWKAALEPHYETAERMLGVVQYQREDAKDRLLREFAESLGVEDTFTHTRVGIFLGPSDNAAPDPYFGGAGPSRSACVLCGGCMVGCRYGAKNTLPKNYLWFAERAGARIASERTVVDVRPLGAPDGSDGYEVTHERSGAWIRRDRQRIRTRGVVFAAGALGTTRLLFRCKLNHSLPDVSSRLGQRVRTNSESVLAVTAPDAKDDYSKGVAISSSIYTDANTHIEPVTYGAGADSQSLLFTLLNDRGSRRTRPAYFLLALLRNPRLLIRYAHIRGWSRRTVFLLVMQTLDGAMALKVKWRLPTGAIILRTEQDLAHPNPDRIPIAYEAARWIARRIGGTPQALVPEAVLSVPTTAHLLGGAVIGRSAQEGVIDFRQRVFGYQNMVVCDGAAIPANIGANPSLTITAMAERAIATVPEATRPSPDYVAAAPPAS